MPIHVPLLNPKVKLLIRSARRPDIQSQQSLAANLDIGVSKFDKILNDRYNLNKNAIPNEIPKDVAKKITDCYYLSEGILLLSNLTVFKQYIVAPEKQPI